jgi:hypothetical protein
MIETVFALLMFVGGEIKEHRIQDSMAKCLRGKRTAERQYNANVKYQCIKTKEETEIYMGEKSILKIILN